MSDKYGAYEVIFDPRFYVDSATGIPVVDSIGQDVDRSREAYILRYTSAQQPAVGKYNNLPVWVAVEAMSFGTLSKIIERGDGGKFQRRLAEEIGVAQGGFASRIKALVYLRNRCAHHSRLWNHSVIDAGATPNNVRSKAKRAYGQFAPRSIVDILASMDDICVRGGFYEPLLPKLITERNKAEYWQGLTL